MEKKGKEKEREKAKRGALVTRATLIRLDAQTECPSAEILSNLHQSPWDSRPGSKSSQTFKWCRKREVWPTGVKKKLILRTHMPRWACGT